MQHNAIEQQKALASEFPLVARWADQLHPILQQKEVINQLLETNPQALINLGFPEDLLEIRALWNASPAAPEVLMTTAHPEKMNLFKIFAIIHMHLLDSFGINRQRKLQVLAQYVGTVPINKTAQFPFRFGDKLGVKYDLLGISTKGWDSSVTLTDEEIAMQAEKFHSDIPSLASALLDAETADMITQLLKEKGIKAQAGKEYKQKILANISIRLERLYELFGESLQLSGSNPSIAHFLMIYEQLLTGHVFTPGFSKGYEEQYGFNTMLDAHNQGYNNLIKATIQLLVNKRGIHLLKEIITSNEGLARLSINNEQYTLTKDNDNHFVIRSQKTGEIQRIQDSQVLPLLLSEQTTILGDLENLAIFAGGKTLHYGSEYGSREHILTALGYTGKAYAYEMQHRIGNDSEHGNTLFLLQGTKTHISLPLAFVLLGSTQLQKLVKEKAGKTNQPYIINPKQFKYIIAQALVDELFI